MFPVFVTHHLDPALWRVGALALAVAVAVVFGSWRRRRDGVARTVSSPDGSEFVTASQVGTSLGEHATLLQVSTQFCRPCRVARGVLGSVAAGLPGVKHVELDAEEHLDLVRRLDVTRSPTIFVLDGGGRVAQRAHGIPTTQQLMTALARHLPRGHEPLGQVSRGTSGAA